MIPNYSDFNHLIKSAFLITNIRRNDITKVKMKFELIDDSILYVSEVTIQESQWFEYGYQWINVDNELIIRWDNSPYHSDIGTSPFHQHIGSDENIHSSEPMTLNKVFMYIETKIPLS